MSLRTAAAAYAFAALVVLAVAIYCALAALAGLSVILAFAAGQAAQEADSLDREAALRASFAPLRDRRGRFLPRRSRRVAPQAVRPASVWQEV